jgi:uncharacterized protein (DUF1501 family)
MTDRRHFLKQASRWGLGALGSTLGLYSVNGHSAAPTGYKALVVVHLNGGCDSNDILVPLDGGYTDYAKARPGIALTRDQLSSLPGTQLGHSMGLNKAMANLLPLFTNQRLAFVVNAGALVKPTTTADVLNGRATLPPFLYSHPEQTQFVQGWLGDSDPSGWGGRAIEALDTNRSLKAPLFSVNTSDNTLVLGQHSRMVMANSGGSKWMGSADLTNSANHWTQTLASLGRLQSANHVEAEFARSFKGVFSDAQEIAIADGATPDPQGNFGTSDIDKRLKFIAKIMPYYKSAGASRQIYHTQWGSFDTHANQRNTTNTSGNDDLDTQLGQLANAMASFDQAMSAAGMGKEVAVLVISEFSRTLDPASGNGSDHAWGGHWMVMGQSVGGGKLYGQKFPSPVLGGEDDAHNGKRGYFVPQWSSDQVAADLLTWLGLPASELTTVLPNLANFTQKTVGVMNA